MHTVTVPGYADPAPPLDDREWRLLLDLRSALGSGAGVARKTSRTTRVHDVRPSRYDGPLLTYSAADWTERFGTEDDAAAVGVSPRRRIVVIRDPYSSLARWGTEIDVGHWNKLAARRSYVQGYRLPPADTPSPFGPPETRFRPFCQEPHFPDVAGIALYVGRERSVWHDYQIGRRVDTH